MSYIYLASPYTGVSDVEMQHRYEATLKFTASRTEQGDILLSRIVHCDDMARIHGLPRHIDFWRRWCRNMLAPASHMWVLRLEGWDTSVGVADEINIWTQILYKHPVFMDP